MSIRTRRKRGIIWGGAYLKALPAYPMCGQWFSSIGHERVKPIDHANREYPRTSTIRTSEDLEW